MFSKIIKTWIEKIENAPISSATWIISFAGIVFVRMMMDVLSGHNPNTIDYAGIILLALSTYGLLALVTIIVLRIFVRTSINKISNLVLVGSSVLLLIMPVDLLLSRGKEFLQTLIFDPPNEWLLDYFTFFGPDPQEGITYGIRFALAISFIGTAYYTWIKTKKIWRIILVPVILYTASFCIVAAPAIIGSIAQLISGETLDRINKVSNYLSFQRSLDIFPGAEFPATNILSIKLTIFYTLAIGICLVIIFIQHNRQKFLAFSKQIRYTRLAGQIIFPLLGTYLAFLSLEKKTYLEFYGWLGITLIVIYAILNWLFAMIQNDIYDREIDKLSPANRNRVLVQGIMTVDEYKNIRTIIFSWGSFIALILGARFFLLSLVLFAIPYLYSTPPFRLRRFPIITNLAIALHGIFLVIFGVYVFYPEPHFRDFPRLIILGVFIAMTLTSSIKDIKDRQADKKMGIITIPTLLGDRNSKLVIASLFCLTYLLAPLILQNPTLLILAIIFGVLTFIIMLAKKMSEKMMFVILLCYLIITFWVHYL